jgi:predicted AAA+ superfamily ATPase
MPKDLSQDEFATTLSRIAAALERLAPAPMPGADLSSAAALVWDAPMRRLEPVIKVNPVDISLQRGGDPFEQVGADVGRNG